MTPAEDRPPRSPFPRRPALLVSVRSAAEAALAFGAGADVIDVKEPSRGPLGRACPSTWRGVREALPSGVPVSVALGDLEDCVGGPAPDCDSLEGIALRKVGFARSGPGWPDRWEALRRRSGGETPWVAVVYSDWPLCDAPHPDEVREAALSTPDCAGVLVDSWDKSRPGRLDRSWAPWFGPIRDSGRFFALAGGLDAGAIRELAPLGPDLFAVRGAACRRGLRGEAIDAGRVVELARLVASIGPVSPPAGGARARPAPG